MPKDLLKSGELREEEERARRWE